LLSMTQAFVNGKASLINDRLTAVHGGTV
jgi:hypothetical protein